LKKIDWQFTTSDMRIKLTLLYPKLLLLRGAGAILMKLDQVIQQHLKKFLFPLQGEVSTWRAHAALRNLFLVGLLMVALTGLSFTAFWEGVELKGFDLLTMLSAPNPPPKSIILVSIDSESFSILKQHTVGVRSRFVAQCIIARPDPEDRCPPWLANPSNNSTIVPGFVPHHQPTWNKNRKPGWVRFCAHAE